MKYIADVLGPGGLFAQKFPGFQSREAQLRFCEAVEAKYTALSAPNRTEPVPPLFIEGPTGVGKSFGYSVPATFHAAEVNPLRSTPRKRTLVVTANIALQEQIINKDLPALAEVVPWKFTYALAKGIGNYLCVAKVVESAVSDVFGGLESKKRLPMAQQQLPGLTDRAFHEQRDAMRIDAALKEWIDTTKIGDFSELPFELSAQQHDKLSTSSDECPGDKCPSADKCFARQARQRFANADIVVANYHLFFIDLMSEGQVLPPYDAVICDEAHNAADIGRDFFGWRMSRHTIATVTRQLLALDTDGDRVNPELHHTIETLADDAFDRWAMIGELRVREKTSIMLPLVAPLTRAIGELEAQANDEGHPLLSKFKFRAAARGCIKAVARIEEWNAIEKAPKTIYFSEVVKPPANRKDQKPRAVLLAKPMDVGEEMKNRLYADPELVCVFTSATLSTVPGDYTHVSSELGAFGAVTMAVESPFDFASNAGIVVLEDIPSKGTERDEAVGRALVDSVLRANGRTLGLFTSNRALELAAAALRRSSFRGRIYVQGDAPRSKLVHSFKTDVGSVLLGVDSFGTGVDVPGEACSLVFIDKIPFPSPDDPMVQAFEEQYGSNTSFREYSMPRALLKLRQWVGRLLRTTTDRGVVVIADSRIHTMGYGKKFLRALPPAPVASTIDPFIHLLRTQ